MNYERKLKNNETMNTEEKMNRKIAKSEQKAASRVATNAKKYLKTQGVDSTVIPLYPSGAGLYLEVAGTFFRLHDTEVRAMSRDYERKVGRTTSLLGIPFAK